MKPTKRQGHGAPAPPKLVVLLGAAPEWQPELGTLLASEGYRAERVAELDAVLPMLAGDSVQALFLAARPLSASDVLLLRRIRATSPQMAVVVVTKTPTDPDLKRAFENGATAFLSWPTSNEAMRHALDRGPFLASAKRATSHALEGKPK